jgi:hypothetical protein
MDKSELAYVVYVKVYEDTEKVRHDVEAKLNQICGLAFIESSVQDANGD